MKYGKMPLEIGVDVISVSSLAFRRLLEIADLLSLEVDVVTDNDGDVAKLERKYKDYISHHTIDIEYDTNEDLRTLEPQLLNSSREIVRHRRGTTEIHD
jgi:putative ATP-dependent endonuclease of OLD family